MNSEYSPLYIELDKDGIPYAKVTQPLNRNIPLNPIIQQWLDGQPSPALGTRIYVTASEQWRITVLSVEEVRIMGQTQVQEGTSFLHFNMGNVIKARIHTP